MDRFIARFGDRITGVLRGFDRMIFHGQLMALNRAEAMEHWLWWKKVLFVDYSDFVQKQSARLKAHAVEMAERAGRPLEHLRSPKVSKEQIAQKIAQRDAIHEGLVCVLTCVEPCMSFTVRQGHKGGRLFLAREQRQCLFVYFYWIDREMGFMHVRIQTWFPFDVQIYINGREWLARRMDREGLAYERRDNCFVQLQDLKRAQELSDATLDTNWASVLNHFAKRINPLLKDLLKELSYYWTLHQGEYATDVMFRDAESLKEVYPSFVDHAIRTFRSEDILRFLGLRKPGHFQGTLESTLRRRSEGVRVRHSAYENSIKMYDKQGSVLRIETTINNPKRFTGYRKVLRKGKQVFKWVPLRKGVADISRRVEISRAANARYLNALASLPEARPSHEILDPVSKPVHREGERFRPLRPVSSDDASLFRCLLRGEFLVNGFRNADVRRWLYPGPGEDADLPGRRAGKVTRCLRLLRAHQLIVKLRGTSRYLLTPKGMSVMSAAIHVRHADLSHLQMTG